MPTPVTQLPYGHRQPGPSTASVRLKEKGKTKKPTVDEALLNIADHLHTRANTCDRIDAALAAPTDGRSIFFKYMEVECIR